jgi:hypothetical protein
MKNQKKKKKGLPLKKEKIEKKFDKDAEIHDELLLRVLSLDEYIPDGKIKRELKIEPTIIEHPEYEWMNKFDPKYPKYYIEAIYGFEWNKYNKIHYNLNNLPPKIVQGTKNI